MDNNYRLYVALNVLNRHMNSFIEKHFMEVYGENWWTEAVDQVVFQSSVPSGAKQILSIEHYQPLIEHHWQQCFVNTFANIVKVNDWLSDIRDLPDKIAPGYPSLSNDDTWRYLDIIESFLRCIDTDSVSDISSLKNDIEDIPGHHSDMKKISDEPMCDNIDDIEKLLSARETIEKKIQEMYYRCITVMFTDLQDSTSIANKEGDIMARLIIKNHDDIVIPLIKSTGTLVKTIGDGTLSYFSSADDALSVAIQIQKDLNHLNCDKKFTTQIRLRIGLHTGVCIVEHNDIRGNIVNIASRFESISKPGEIYLSEDTYNALSCEKKGLCRYLHTTAIKGISDEKFKVYRVSQDEPASEDCLPSLQIKDNPEDILYIKSGEVLIGRSGECNLMLEDSYVSRRHARVYYKQDNYFIEDLNSKFGVSVNGRKVSEQRLNSGDIILIGKKTIIFTNPAEESDTNTSGGTIVEDNDRARGRFMLLRITASGEKKEHYQLTPEGITIGRLRGNSTIKLDDFSVSKNHARVWLEQDKVFVEDLNSKNGTFVGDKMIPRGEAFELPRGKNIKIGSSQFMVFDTDTTIDSDMI